MKKRFLAILVVATLTLSLFACGGKADKDTGSDDTEAKSEKIEVDVVTGISNATEIEIISGLKEGDQVIVK